MLPMKEMMRETLTAVVGSVLWASAVTVSAQTELNRVEITGSAIKRVEAEGPSPVEIVTRKDIERTGATSVNELVRSISSLDIVDFGELSSGSPSSGTANIRLRGLSENNVLVLLNGRRLPISALYASSGAGAAVDVNMIPLSVVERIEILKDGGSAIYGADAVAGVVNFITRRDFEGVEARISHGTSSRHDANENRFGLTVGIGDLNKDRFNLLWDIDVFRRDPILRSARDGSRTSDFRRFGGPDARSTFAPAGNVLDPNDSYAPVGLTYSPCAPENVNGACRYDNNQSVLTAYNGADRLGGVALATWQATPEVRAFAEMVYSTAQNRFALQPVPGFFLVPVADPSQAAYQEGPPNAGKMYIAGRFLQGGLRVTDSWSSLLHTAVGAEGTHFGLDWKFSVGRGTSTANNTDSDGYYDSARWDAATASGQLNPTLITNDPALVQSLKVRAVREGRAVNDYINLQVGGEVMKLPAGALGFALGASLTRESLRDQPDALLQAGGVLGDIAQSAVDASRHVRAVFGELSIPVLAGIEAQAALRHDRYPTVAKTSPKVALKYSVMPSLAFRASYTESFRAPLLKQLYGAQEEGALTISDDAQCRAIGVTAPCRVDAYLISGSNTALTPETGKTYNIGAIFQVSDAFNASVDVWKIRKADEINTPTVAKAIEQGLFSRVGARLNVFTNLQNIAHTESAGVDLDARWRFPRTSLGSLTLRNLLTYYGTVKTRQRGASQWDEFNGTYRYPRFRNNLRASAERGPWTLTGTWRTVGGFWDTDQPYPIAAGTRRVGVHEECDVQLQYTGVKNMTLTVGADNLFDRAPPFSVTNAGDGQYTQTGFAEIYNNRGRFFYVSASYRFR